MTSNVLVRIPRDLVVVSGPDATSFLQSLLSQDLDPVAVGAAVHSLLLEPRGKLVADLRAAHVRDDEWWCVCERGVGPELAEGLTRFRIRVKVEIDDRSAGVVAIALRGPDAPRLWAAFDAPELVAIAVDWPGDPGIEVLGPPAAVDAAARALVAAGAVELDDAAYEARRIEAGAPRQGHDLDDRTIAQEAYLERDAVSFTKGCFLGQELVCRIDSRGHVNRLLRRLRADAPVARGDVVVAGGKEVGAVTSAAGPLALAMLRREVEPASAVAVRTTGGDVAARVEAVDD